MASKSKARKNFEKSIKMVNGQIDSENEKEVFELQREFFKKMLEVNIIVKKTNLLFAETGQQQNMCYSSIRNSEEALKRINQVKNFEAFNHLHTIIMIEFGQQLAGCLSYVSGSLNDDNFYKFDESLTNAKAAGGNDGN